MRSEAVSKPLSAPAESPKAMVRYDSAGPIPVFGPKPKSRYRSRTHVVQSLYGYSFCTSIIKFSASVTLALIAKTIDIRRIRFQLSPNE